MLVPIANLALPCTPLPPADLTHRPSRKLSRGGENTAPRTNSKEEMSSVSPLTTYYNWLGYQQTPSRRNQLLSLTIQDKTQRLVCQGHRNVRFNSTLHVLTTVFHMRVCFSWPLPPRAYLRTQKYIGLESINFILFPECYHTMIFKITINKKKKTQTFSWSENSSSTHTWKCF